ncbi:prepilin peptidase [Streptomyces ruber]|uniref:Prepilin peptidase n=2 Tax=Streptomyces TaxID=1883 RepID=A0A918ERW2_9ACTN|nr:A24 family peptidase [Streptomyces ruber]GGQ62528.1 prepilin peptidase [Streptomyces ruber]
MSESLLIFLAALWGAAAGGLLPRAAHRLAVPPEEPWRSACPAGHPVRGWLGRARCAPCGHAYGRALPVACVTAVACAVSAAATGPRPELAVWLLLAPVAVLLSLVDLRVHRLPDVLTLPLAGAALVLLGAAALVPGHAGQWRTAVFGALALGGLYLVLFLVRPDGFGFGDVKLGLGLGAVLGWYGWGVVVLGAFAGILFAGLYGLVLALARRIGRRTAYPIGPALIAGAYVALLLGAHAV